MQGTKKVAGYKTPVGNKGGRLGPEHNPWYWNPNRVGAGEAPAWFQVKLREVDPENMIDVRWNPVAERWAAFYRKPNFSHPLCQGWTLLMKVEYPDGSYMPLDERFLAALFNASARKWGNGEEYFRAIEREIERDREKKEKRATQEAIDIAMPFFEHSQIKNIGSGSKFSDYHS